MAGFAGLSTGSHQPNSTLPESLPAMDRAMLAEHLVQAECHIVLGESHLERQRGVVAEYRRQGLNATEAVDLLKRFEKLQAMHVADRDRLRKELGL